MGNFELVVFMPSSGVFHAKLARLKENDMTPADVEQMAKQQGVSVEVYFQRAMKWRYGQLHDTYLDFLKFDVHYIVPKYVAEYTKYLVRLAEVSDLDSNDFADDLYPVILTRGD
jgi:hypothetical protein